MGITRIVNSKHNRITTEMAEYTQIIPEIK